MRDHLHPIWSALPVGQKGGFYKGDRLPRRANGSMLGGPAVVASYNDMRVVRNANRPVILAEHGAGQSYVGEDNGAYIGAPDREGVIGVLVPGEIQRARHLEAHPDIPAYAVGCPKLDRWLLEPSTPEPDLVAITWHWDRNALPETRSAWDHYVGGLRSLSQRFRLLGHAHPLWGGALWSTYEKLGIEWTKDPDEVLARAAVLVADNTSMLYEFAALGRPVVTLNAPWYRRDVEHGLRFWSHIPGPQCDSPDDLVDVVEQTLRHPLKPVSRALDVAGQVYGPLDGGAAQRAAQAVLSIVEDL